MLTVTKGKALLTTTAGGLPRPSWYTANLNGAPLSQGFTQQTYREQHFDCLASHVAAQHRAGLDIMVDGDARLDDDAAGRSWITYATERIEGIGTPSIDIPPSRGGSDKGGADLMREVLQSRVLPPVMSSIGRTTLQLDRAYKAIAPMTDKPVKIGSISAQTLALLLIDEHYRDRFRLLMDLSAALNREYHALADAGAPIVQIEQPAIHQIVGDPNQRIGLDGWVDAFNAEVKGLREKCEVWCHTSWGSPAARPGTRGPSYKAALPYLDQLDVDVIAVEAAHNNGADLELFGSMISKNKKIALGVVSHRTMQVEWPEEIADLIRRALKVIEPERLILTSDNGFGRSATRMHAAYKMMALVRGANIVRKEIGLPEAYIPGADSRLSMAPGARALRGWEVDSAERVAEPAPEPFDPRITPARPDLAAAFLRGKVEASRFVEGTVQEVIVGVAEVRKEPSHESPQVTEALHGERVTVYETTEEGWCWCQLKSDGYVGWLPAAALLAPGPQATRKVSALRTFIFPGPSIKLTPMESLPLGSRVPIVRYHENFAVTASGGYLPKRHLVPLDSVELDFVEVAERFIDAPYLWGGKTSMGIDCSGLVQVALTACGATCPRDSDMQEAALGTPVNPAEVKRGDLVFWRGHVAIARNAASLVHANAHHMAVAIEPLGEAIARIRASGSEVTSVRRLG